MGLGQDKQVCRRPLGARNIAQTSSSLVLELVVVCGRQGVKDAGAAVCGTLMGDRVWCDEVEGVMELLLPKMEHRTKPLVEWSRRASSR
jgi:hypothetical protein